jgi:hypothetical protein
MRFIVDSLSGFPRSAFVGAPRGTFYLLQVRRDSNRRDSPLGMYLKMHTIQSLDAGTNRAVSRERPPPRAMASSSP